MNLKTFISAGESQTLEFTTSFDKATVESLVTFANAQGGTVLLGVTDKGGGLRCNARQRNIRRMVRANQICDQPRNYP